MPGYYCAAENNTAPSKCLAIPADCGIAGNPCCPSNTEAPHNASIQKIDKKPFCRDGSTCFYDPTAPLLTLDIYAGIPGVRTAPAWGLVGLFCGSYSKQTQ